MALWTWEHLVTLLPALAVMVFVAWILRRTIGKKPLKIRMIPFQILASLLFVIEVIKQIISLRNGYEPGHLPLHFCSMFMVALPLMAFYRGKYQAVVFEIVTALCLTVTLVTLINPTAIYTGENIRRFFVNYFEFHTVTYHNIILFETILIPMLKLYRPAGKMYTKPLVAVVLIFCVISASMAQILKINFTNFYRCNFSTVEAIRVCLQGVLGYCWTQLLYVLAITGVITGFVVLCAALYRKGWKLARRR